MTEKKPVVYLSKIKLNVSFCLTDSAHSFGATVACILAGIAMSTFGRRGATLLCTVPCYLFGYITIGCASNYVMLILGRFLTGLGLGMTLTVPNVYICEVTSPEYRDGEYFKSKPLCLCLVEQFSEVYA